MRKSIIYFNANYNIILCKSQEFWSGSVLEMGLEFVIASPLSDNKILSSDKGKSP